MTDDRTLGDILAEAMNATPPPPIVAAGHGDLAALRFLANAAYATARDRTGTAALISYIEAATFARLAAAHEADRGDCVNLVFLLDDISSHARCMGDAELGNAFEAQAVMLAELMAENGDDEMGDMVAACGDKIAPEVLIEAQRLRGLVSA